MEVTMSRHDPRTAFPALCLVAAGALLLPAASSARTWYVNPAGTGDAPTIAAAFDSCVAGDEVLLAPGTYNEHDLWLPGGVTLRGEAGRDATVIDVAYLIDGAVLEGITVQRGSGAGLTSWGGRVDIRDCRFRENEAYREGGGVYCAFQGGGITKVTNTIFEGNTGADAGGGLVIETLPILGSPADGGWR
jgi:hypothetical protein